MSDDGLPGMVMVVTMLIGMVFTMGICVKMLLWLPSAVMVAWHVLAQG